MFDDIVSTLAKLAGGLEPGCEGWRAVNELQRWVIELLSDGPVDASSCAFTLERAARRGLRKEARPRLSNRRLPPRKPSLALEMLRLLEPAEPGTWGSSAARDSRGSAPPRVAAPGSRSLTIPFEDDGTTPKQAPGACHKCLDAPIGGEPCLEIAFGEGVATMCGPCVAQFPTPAAALMALLAITSIADDGEA
jgi:hypothetical protein